jgi:hypothetical protein
VTGGPDAVEWLRQARLAVGLPAAEGAVIHWSGSETDVQFYQSDRPYPPYIAAVSTRNWWFDPATGVERSDPTDGGMAFLGSANATYLARDTMVQPLAMFHYARAAYRGLSPYAVLADMGAGARVAERCGFRGFPRVVLEQDGRRLYLDEKSAMPVKFEQVEQHPTWGQVLAEHVYTTWWRGDGVSIPIATVRYIDGVEHLRRDVALPRRAGDMVVGRVSRDSASRLQVPPADHRDAGDPFATPVPVDTVRVDDTTYLLTTRQYTHAVTLQSDTVFLFDATTGDWRSRADSTWIEALFGPGHPVVLVVTDLAWPHIGGVRFWVSRGAQVVTHRLSVPFLEQLVTRRWTLAPDALELAEGARRPVIRGIDAATPLARGAVRVAPIDGASSEGALYAGVPGAGFLWAGDYIQGVDTPSQYAMEVVAAAARDGVAPTRVAAQHLPLTAWNVVLDANPRR